MKLHTCCVELFCLLLNKIFNNAKLRVYFENLKIYYHCPFIISKEVCFEDKIEKRMADKFYNFEQFLEDEYYNY